MHRTVKLSLCLELLIFTLITSFLKKTIVIIFDEWGVCPIYFIDI